MVEGFCKYISSKRKPKENMDILLNGIKTMEKNMDLNINKLCEDEMKQLLNLDWYLRDSEYVLVPERYAEDYFSYSEYLDSNSKHETRVPLLLFKTSRLVYLEAGKVEPGNGALAASNHRISKESSNLSKPRATPLLLFACYAGRHFPWGITALDSMGGEVQLGSLIRGKEIEHQVSVKGRIADWTLLLQNSDDDFLGRHLPIDQQAQYHNARDEQVRSHTPYLESQLNGAQPEEFQRMTEVLVMKMKAQFSSINRCLESILDNHMGFLGKAEDLQNVCAIPEQWLETGRDNKGHLKRP
ncbi:hypothetical protein llap_2989 [Limosa lapponica baueri]|uniref:Uncharacterized protein n=1 Tax=Limosa lapponica baueri TaxID=1758121 RepID=A0A2I0UKV1_LIMLA|nr:hypothetical protein llap_2989 [Limosa lapponica baueri]